MPTLLDDFIASALPSLGNREAMHRSADVKPDGSLAAGKVATAVLCSQIHAGVAVVAHVLNDDADSQFQVFEAKLAEFPEHTIQFCRSAFAFNVDRQRDRVIAGFRPTGDR